MEVKLPSCGLQKKIAIAELRLQSNILLKVANCDCGSASFKLRSCDCGLKKKLRMSTSVKLYTEHCVTIWVCSIELAEYIKPKIQWRHLFADLTILHLGLIQSLPLKFLPPYPHPPPPIKSLLKNIPGLVCPGSLPPCMNRLAICSIIIYPNIMSPWIITKSTLKTVCSYAYAKSFI